MSDVSITLSLSKSCPDILFTRAIVPTFSTQLQPSDFNQYATLTLTYPNGQVLNLSSLDQANWIDPTSDTIDLETLLVGLFSIEYTALPSLRPSQSQNYFWVSGDNFYDGGNIYQVNANGITIPNTGISNASQIATYLGNGDLTIITVDEINPQYDAVILPGSTFQFWCNLLVCLIDKQHKLNKQNLKGLNVSSIKETEELDVILQLYIIYNYLLINTLDPNNATQNQMIVTFSNYINTICGCCNCDNDSSCGGGAGSGCCDESSFSYTTNIPIASPPIPQTYRILDGNGNILVDGLGNNINYQN